MAITVTDIERMMNSLKDNHQELVHRKKSLDAKLADIKNRIRGNGRALPQLEYQALCRKQSEYKTEIVHIDRDISSINSELRKKQVIRDEIYYQQKVTIDKLDTSAKSQLITLRDEYMQFASDTTRISSMRAMASKIAEELESIIKKV